MIRNLTRVAFATLAISIGLAAAGQAQILVGVSFEGRGGASLAITDIAGVMPQGNFNNITTGQFSPPDNGQGTGFTFASPTLLDSTGAVTPVTFSIMANDSWRSESGNGAPNNTLLNGIVKANGSQTVVPLTINGLTAGDTYTLDVYTTENGANGNYSLTDGTTTFFQQSQNGSSFDGTFIPAANTTNLFVPNPDPANAGNPLNSNPIANYAEFTGTVAGNGTLALSYTYVGGSDGTGISGFQIRTVPEPTTLTLGALSGLGMLGLLRRRKA